MNKSILVSLCTIAISQILALGAAMAQDADRLKAAERLAEEIGLSDQFAAGFDAMMPMIKQQSAQLELDAKQSKQLEAIYRAWFMQDIDHEKVSKEMIKLYAVTFTTEELEGLSRFYKTPLGKKALKTLPELTQKGAMIGMEAAQAKEAELEKRLKPFFEKIQEAKFDKILEEGQ